MLCYAYLSTYFDFMCAYNVVSWSVLCAYYWVLYYHFWLFHKPPLLQLNFHSPLSSARCCFFAYALFSLLFHSDVHVTSGIDGNVVAPINYHSVIASVQDGRVLVKNVSVLALWSQLSKIASPLISYQYWQRAVLCCTEWSVELVICSPRWDVFRILC